MDKGVKLRDQSRSLNARIRRGEQMGKIVFLVVVFLLLIPVTVLCQVTYESKDKLLSVKSEGKLLTEVLSDVSAKTGIEVYMNPANDRKISVDIRRQPIEKALREVVKPLNNAFVYQGKSIKAVKIFEKSEGEATARVLPGVTPSVSTPGSAAADLKTPPTRDDVLKRLQERRRQIAISQGRLKEFEAKEAAKEKRMKEREKRRSERFKEREKMRAERMAIMRARIKERSQGPQQAPQGQPTERTPRRNPNLEGPSKDND
jgi:hypothetical protein